MEAGVGEITTVSRTGWQHACSTPTSTRRATTPPQTRGGTLHARGRRLAPTALPSPASAPHRHRPGSPPPPAASRRAGLIPERGSASAGTGGVVWGLPRPVPEVLGLPRSAIATSGRRPRRAGPGPRSARAPRLTRRLPTAWATARWTRKYVPPALPRNG